MKGAGPRIVVGFALIVAGLAPHVVFACDPVSLPPSRAPGSVLLLATAARIPPLATGVRVEVLAGRGPTEAMAVGPAILVPWAYGPDCKPIPWNSDHAWSPPGTPAVYTTWLRPRARWIDGVQTFDVYMAVREPLWRSDDSRGYVASTGEPLLTPAEFLDFYAVLPTDPELEQRLSSALSRVEDWESTHPALAAREPARSILSSVRRTLTGADIVAQFSSYLNGERWDFTITESMPWQAPTWDEADPSPPLPLRAAMTIAATQLGHLLSNPEQWRLSSISLWPIGGRRGWVYVVQYGEPSGAGTGGIASTLSLVVLMNGSTVSPTRRRWPPGPERAP